MGCDLGIARARWTSGVTIKTSVRSQTDKNIKKKTSGKNAKKPVERLILHNLVECNLYTEDCVVIPKRTLNEIPVRIIIRVLNNR